jgi:hypothetical protein
MLALMRDNPGATVARLVELSGRPRSSTVLSLNRLELAGVVNHRGHGSWVAAENNRDLAPVEDDPDLPPVEGDPDLKAEGSPLPSRTANWVAPLSGKHVARHTADGRVREQPTAACAL